jgi:hypothetical protein
MKPKKKGAAPKPMRKLKDLASKKNPKGGLANFKVYTKGEGGPTSPPPPIFPPGPIQP